jgi:hypothetical protein
MNKSFKIIIILMVENIPKGVKLKIEDSEMAENIPVELIQRGIIISDKEEKQNKIIILEVTIKF